jgi:hypothetical protein
MLTYEKLHPRAQKTIFQLADRHFGPSDLAERLRFVDSFARAVLAGEVEADEKVAIFEFSRDDGRPLLVAYDPLTWDLFDDQD